MSWIQVFGRLHPLLLHLPIGVVAALGLLELVAIAKKRPAAKVPALAWFAALSACLVAATGYTLSQEGGYDPAHVTPHLRFGIAAAIGTLAILFTRGRAYRVAVFATMGLLVGAGHFGSILTRGEGFLTAPLSTRAPVTAGARSTYQGTIAPIFAARCSACHGETKQKGGLKLTTPEALLAGGKDGPVFVAGHPEKSELVRRAHLPIDDDDHMPPEGKTQLTDGELAAIEAWIRANAPLEGVVPEAEKFGAAVPAQPIAIASADANALAALRRELVHVAPVAANSNLLEIDFSPAGASVTDARVGQLLEPVREQIARLSFARCAITDATLSVVARMPRLTHLDLSSTAITDGGIEALSGHGALTELVLVRTKLTDAAALSLAKLPALERVYVWRSGLGTAAIARLRNERPTLVVESGDELTRAPLETQPLTQASAPINAVCPVSGSPVDPAHTLVFRGRVIGFCCDKCPKKFEADPDAYAAKLP